MSPKFDGAFVYQLVCVDRQTCKNGYRPGDGALEAAVDSSLSIQQKSLTDLLLHSAVDHLAGNCGGPPDRAPPENHQKPPLSGFPLDRPRSALLDI